MSYDIERIVANNINRAARELEEDKRIAARRKRGTRARIALALGLIVLAYLIGYQIGFVAGLRA